MADRRVRQTGKDQDGGIAAVCNGVEYWSPCSEASAVSDIRARTHGYYVHEATFRMGVVFAADLQLTTKAEGWRPRQIDKSEVGV